MGSTDLGSANDPKQTNKQKSPTHPHKCDYSQLEGFYLIFGVIVAETETPTHILRANRLLKISV